jgi:hypothetical protein
MAFGRCLPFLKAADLATVLTDNTEGLLMLPGKLPFFPMKPTQMERITSLLERLHPIRCSTPLIRFGPAGDGGYLIPDDLVNIEACFSPGVNNVAGFELDCARAGMKVFMADASVETPPERHPSFVFTKKFVGATSGADFMTFEEWIEQSGISRESDLMLQMDIEGHEYETFISMPPALLERFRIIVVEFHCLDYLFSEPLFRLYSCAFEKILRTHSCVHIHPNNVCPALRIRDFQLPQMAEFTFLRKDRISDSTFETRFPNPLDRDNTVGPTLVLPPSMYRRSRES